MCAVVVVWRFVCACFACYSRLAQTHTMVWGEGECEGAVPEFAVCCMTYKSQLECAV